VNTGNLPSIANISLCVKRVTHCTLLDQSNNPGTTGEHENGAAQASLGTVLLDRSNNSLSQDAESASMNAEQVIPCTAEGKGPASLHGFRWDHGKLWES
jgi:hypothetical protein